MHQIAKPIESCIMEKSNVTTPGIIIDKNTYGDDLNVQVDEELFTSSV